MALSMGSNNPKVNKDLDEIKIIMWIEDYKTFGEKSYVANCNDIMNQILNSRYMLTDIELSNMAATYLLNNGWTPDQIIQHMNIFEYSTFKESLEYSYDIWSKYKDTLSNLILHTISNESQMSNTISIVGTDTITLNNVYLCSVKNGITSTTISGEGTYFSTRRVVADNNILIDGESSHNYLTSTRVTPNEFFRTVIISNMDKNNNNSYESGEIIYYQL